MLCRTNELEQESQLFASMGRMQDMTQNFQIVEQQQGDKSQLQINIFNK